MLERFAKRFDPCSIFLQDLYNRGNRMRTSDPLKILTLPSKNILKDHFRAIFPHYNCEFRLRDQSRNNYGKAKLPDFPGNLITLRNNFRKINFLFLDSLVLLPNSFLPDFLSGLRVRILVY